MQQLTSLQKICKSCLLSRVRYNNIVFVILLYRTLLSKHLLHIFCREVSCCMELLHGLLHGCCMVVAWKNSTPVRRVSSEPSYAVVPGLVGGPTHLLLVSVEGSERRTRTHFQTNTRTHIRAPPPPPRPNPQPRPRPVTPPPPPLLPPLLPPLPPP
jgi:hypothetical protein